MFYRHFHWEKAGFPNEKDMASTIFPEEISAGSPRISMCYRYFHWEKVNFPCEKPSWKHYLSQFLLGKEFVSPIGLIISVIEKVKRGITRIMVPTLIASTLLMTSVA